MDTNIEPYSPTVVAGKWHEETRPAHNAAFRMCYFMMMQRYHPDAVLISLREVFLGSGLLPDEECVRIRDIAVGFAAKPVEGNA